MECELYQLRNGRPCLARRLAQFEKVNNPLGRSPEAELISRGNAFKECTVTAEEADKGAAFIAQEVAQGAAFDPKAFYVYTLDKTERVPDLLRQYSGPQASIGTQEMAALMVQPKRNSAISHAPVP